jgi:hypothetical protein
MFWKQTRRYKKELWWLEDCGDWFRGAQSEKTNNAEERACVVQRRPRLLQDHRDQEEVINALLTMVWYFEQRWCLQYECLDYLSQDNDLVQ